LGKGKGKEAVNGNNIKKIMGRDVKRMRLETEEDYYCSSSSGSNSSIPTPTSNSPPAESSTLHINCHYMNDPGERDSQYPQYPFNISNQTYAHQQAQTVHHFPHKLHPLRISTRSNASPPSLMNPYDNINSVLYLAHLTRNSHIVNELEEDLGDMEIDERHVGDYQRNSGQREPNFPEESFMSLSSDNPRDMSFDGASFLEVEAMSVSNSFISSDPSSSIYANINSVLRDAFLRRRRGNEAQMDN